MIERVIITFFYQPGTAATNRIIAYAKGFYYLGKKIALVLGYDNEKPEIELEGVEIIAITANHHSIVPRNIAKEVKKRYNSGDVILTYGSPLLCLFLPKRKYNIFYECTEVPLYGKSQGIHVHVKEWVKRFLTKRATGMFVISHALKDLFSQQGIEHITIINMFVDVERFNIVTTQCKEKYIAYCGTISPFKDGVDCLIKAFAIFHQQHPDYRLKLIGGIENDAAEKYLKKLVDELEVKDFIHFTGRVLPDEMPTLLCGAQLLALARPNNRQAQFGFPTKLGEYLATGKPVVVTNVGEMVCFLKDGENCRMAQPNDEQDFAEKMSWVANHYEEALRLGRKGRELTKMEFSSVEQSKKALAFMEIVIKKDTN